MAGVGPYWCGLAAAGGVAMDDVIYIGLAVGFFVLTAFFVRLCDRV